MGFIEFEIKCALIGDIKDAIQKSLINPHFYIGDHWFIYFHWNDEFNGLIVPWNVSFQPLNNH